MHEMMTRGPSALQTALGFSRLEEPAGVLMQVHPRLRGSSVLEDEMLDWAAR
jgi:hypothetical protein